MKLLLDIGNSRLKWAWLDKTLRPGGAVSHREQGAAALESILLTGRPAEIWAASVAGDGLREAVEAWAQRSAKLAIRWVRSEAMAYGVRNGYRVPEQLGVDRWLAVIAAYRRAGGAALVVDAGTAVTLDIVTSDGRHRGGLIAPGLGLQRLSLRQQTQLRPEETGSLHWLASDTSAAVAWGSLHGVLGLIERVSAGICRDYGPMRRYLTGGEAGTLLPHLQGSWDHVPDLVVEGLAMHASHDSLRAGT